MNSHGDSASQARAGQVSGIHSDRYMEKILSSDSVMPAATGRSDCGWRGRATAAVQ